ncbi:MAG: co-chaperone DjlA [Gammaproteobacteria bacterium]|nr:co-chaperone DjlA [Gammaproteobacteria bacterium]
MSWWGKIAGGAFGFLAGGPLGAALGAAIGHSFDKGMNGQDDRDPGEVQTAFFAASFSLLGAVAKADGRVSQDEIQTAERLMSEMQLTSDMRSAAISLFNQGKNFSATDIDEAVLQFRQISGRSRHLHMALLRLLVRGALSDQDLHPGERDVLERVATGLGLPSGLIEQVATMFSGYYGRQNAGAGAGQQQSRAPAQMGLREAATILGIEATATEAEAKKAYRRLMSQNHPDRLVAKGVPEEMVKAATAKTAEIGEAYDVYKSARGWR